MVHAVVEPEHIRLIFVYQLQISVHPVGEKFLRRRVAAVGDVIKLRPVRIVKIGVRGFQARVQLGVRIDEGEILNAVVGDAELQSLFPHGHGKFANQIALRPHLFGVDGRHIAVPHGEIVVMLGGGDDVFRAGLLKQVCPFIRVKFFAGEQRDEILVAEFLLRPEMFRVPFLIRGIHVFLIPLVVIRGDGIDAPVHEQSELRVLKPCGRLVILRDRIPRRRERPRRHRLGDVGAGSGNHFLRDRRPHAEALGVRGWRGDDQGRQQKN